MNKDQKEKTKTFICSSCLAEVDRLYQLGTCRDCLQQSFKRLRPLFKLQNRKDENNGK